MSWSSHDARRIALALAVAAMSAAAAAQTGPRVEFDLQGLGADNPFLLPGRDRAAGVAEATVRPHWSAATPTGSTIALDGVLTDRAYTNGYGNFVVGRGDVRATYRDSERLSISGAAQVSRDLAVDLLTSAVEASSDPRSLRTGVTGSASLTWRPDEYNTFEPSLAAERYAFSRSSILGDTRSLTASLAYRRRVSALTSIGLRAGSVFNRTARLSDTSTQMLYATVERRLGTGWRATAELGFERNAARVEQVLGDRVAQRARVLLSGRGEICRAFAGPTVCAAVSLNSEISGLGGLQRRAVGSVTVDQQFDARTTFRGRFEYQRAVMQGGVFPDFDTMRGDLSLDRRLDERLTLGATGRYLRRQLVDGSRIGGVYAGLRLRYRLGAR